MPKSATAYAIQLVKGTPAASSAATFLRHLEKHVWQWVTAADIPHFERNQRAIEGDLLPTTIYAKGTLEVRIDSRQFVRMMMAAASYAYIGGKHTFIFGDTIAAYLTLWFHEGNSAEMFRCHDVRIDTVEVSGDWTAGTAKAKIDWVGQPAAVLTSGLPTISIPQPTTGKLPFTGKQSVLLRAGAAFCPITSVIKIMNHVEAEWCGPGTDPVAGEDPYQAPDDISGNEATGTLQAVARYISYTATALEDYRLAREQTYILRHTNPNVSPAHVLQWTFPRFVPKQGALDPDTTKRRKQNVEGPLLLSDATGGLALFEVQNDESTYAS